MLQERMAAKHGVVRLDDRGRDLRRRVDGERELGLAAVVDREALEEQGAEAGAGATADGVEEEETLEAGAIVGELRGGGGKRTRGRGEAREKARGRSGAIDKRGRGISNERCSWGAGRVGRAPCGCGRGRGRRSPCRRCLCRAGRQPRVGYAQVRSRSACDARGDWWLGTSVRLGDLNHQPMPRHRVRLPKISYRHADGESARARDAAAVRRGLCWSAARSQWPHA